MTAAASRSFRPSRTGAAAEPTTPAAAAEGPRLRLAAARGTLGLELDVPYALRPLRLVALSLTFPNIRFPIDLSGGVTRFRHRRGVLSRLAIDVSPAELATWAAPRLRGLLRDSTPDLWLAPIEGGLAAGIADGEAALAFDVLVLPSGAGLTLLVERARGIGLGVPPQALALRALAAALGNVAAIEGGALRVRAAAAMLLRAALPVAGARAPSVGAALWDVARVDGDRLRLEAQLDIPPPALPDRLVRASETLLLTEEAEDSAYRGDTDRARDRYLAALERAPRHPEISERLAWLDAVAGERAEAALSTLVDVTPAAFAGLLGAELLAAVGDAEGARGALARAARAEPFGPLAARTWLRAAALADDLTDRLAALDEAVARAPALPDARWARLEGRLTAADPRAALADAEHLEAAVRGSRARHDVARRAARAFLAAGFSTEALRLFERALRYVPDDAEAVAGLARALAAQGSTRRALDLFARALSLAERAGAPTSAVAVDLAKALVDVASDRPAAIARVRSVPASAPEAPEARLLEARWRAELGDVAGAGLALGRLRDQIERDPTLTAGPPAPGTAAAARAIALAALLSEAASIDERARDDLAGAQRDLALAMRLAPRDARLQTAFRRIARAAAARPATSRPFAAGPPMPAPPRRASAAMRARAPSPLPPIPTPPPSVDLGVEIPAVTPQPVLDDRDLGSDLEVELPTMRPGVLPLPSLRERPAAPYVHEARAPAADSSTGEAAHHAGSPDEDATPHAPLSDEATPHVPPAEEHEPPAEELEDAHAEDEALAEELAARLRANPRDRATVLALCDVLDRLGRDLDLLALLSARMDEGDEDERRTLAPSRRAVLARLATRARAAGNASEAELYEMMLGVPDE
jgi:tetratricopeptide (TPR) repeat protein